MSKNLRGVIHTADDLQSVFFKGFNPILRGWFMKFLALFFHD